MIAGLQDTRQDVVQFGFVVDELHQRSAAGATFTDAKNVFGGRVQADDQQVAIEKNDTAGQRVDDRRGLRADQVAVGAVA